MTDDARSPVDATFAQLRSLADDAGTLGEPTATFTDRLRRKLAAALDTDPPMIQLPQRKAASDMNASTTTPASQILTPYLAVHDGAEALDWYRDAFGATETVRYVGDDGRIGHAEFVFAGARVMLSDAYPEIGVVAANTHEGSSCALHVEVADCDDLFASAVAAGATSMSEPADQPHGARSATVLDPFGHRWMLSQQLTNPSSAEIDAAYDDFTVVEPD